MTVLPIRCAGVFVLFALAGGLHPAGSAHGQATEKAFAVRPGGFVDVNAYYDTREFSTITANVLTNLGAGLQYFSFVNYFSTLETAPSTDLAAFYSEQHVRWKPFPRFPVDLTAMAALASGPGNDVARLGLRWRVSETAGLSRVLAALHTSYTLNLHALQFDRINEPGRRGQIEHVYRVEIPIGWLGRSAYLGGFVDHNLWFNPPEGRASSTVVTEHQFGVALAGSLHAVAEWRYNHGLRSAGKASGLGFGFQYVLPFYLAN